MKTYKELDFETGWQMFFFELRFIAKTSHFHPGFVDHRYETIIPHDNQFEVIYTMQDQGVKSAIQQVELNRNLQRVNQGNYFALRYFLN